MCLSYSKGLDRFISRLICVQYNITPKPINMSFFIAASIIFFLYLIIFKVLNLKSRAAPPELKFIDSKFNRAILDACPIFKEPYVPTSLWGKSGHIQTAIYAKIGRFQAPYPKGVRKSHVMPDGATTSFDTFERLKEHPTGGDYTICVVPGISNSSEKAYVRSFILWGQSQGFRVAVLNHIGALEGTLITSPRIFTYGDTEEYAVMIQQVKELYPSSTLLSVGFSMGANIVVKYLGEDLSRQDDFICALSLCQGYDITKWAGKDVPDKGNTSSSATPRSVVFTLVRACVVLHQWEGMRRVYNFLMTQNMLKTIRRNLDMLVGEGALAYWKAKNQAPIKYDVDKILRATSLVHLDEHLSHKMKGYTDIIDFYEEASSSAYIDKIHIPMLLLNSADDTIIPPTQLFTPGEYVQNAPKALYAMTKHGGHLGFFEGGILKANTVTWMDRAVTEYMNGVIEVTQQQRGKEADNGIMF